MIYWLLNSALIGIMLYLAWKQLRPDLPRWVFYGSLGLKLIAGLATGIIFYHYYPQSDSIRFFESTKVLLQQSSLSTILFQPLEIPSYAYQPRVLFFLKILSGFTYATGQSYWITILWFASLSFVVSWWATREWIKIFPRLKFIITASLLFIPSILFWSSGVLKDTLAYIALLILVTIALRIRESLRFKWPELILLVISLYLLFAIKHYLLITFLLFAGILFGIMIFKSFRGVGRWVLSLGVLILFFISTQFIHPYLTFQRIPQTIFENNLVINKNTQEEMQLGITLEEASWDQVIKNIPLSLYTGLFRPSISDKTPIVGIVHKGENLLLLTLAILTLLIIAKQRPAFDWSLLVPSLLAICLLATLMAMATPNLGTLVRYKNAFMPYLFILVSAIPIQYLTSESNG